MKKILYMLMLLNIVALTSYAQLNLKGAIIDKETGVPVNVRIVISSEESGSWTAFSTSNFHRKLDLNDEYKLVASCYGYKEKVIIINAKCPYNKAYTIDFDIEMVRENSKDKSYKLMSGSIVYNKINRDFICTTKTYKEPELIVNKD